MDEVRELSGLVPGQEEPRAPHKEDLRGADACRVELVVHYDGAGAVQRDAPVLIAKALRGAAVRLP